jgi:hypothetical protein
LNSSPNPTYKKSHWIFSMWLATLAGRGKRDVIRRQISESTLNEGNPATFGQIHPSPTSQPIFQLLNNIVTIMLSLVGGPQL